MSEVTFGGVSLDPQEAPPVPGTISLPPEPGSPSLELPPIDFTKDMPTPVGVPVANRRAQMADFGLGKQSPGTDILSSGITNGDEDKLRVSTAANHDVQMSTAKTAMIKGILSKPQAEPQDAQDVKDIATDQTVTDPKTYWEKAFGHQYVNHTVDLNDGVNPVAEGLSTKPTETLDAMDVASWAVARKLSAQKLREDIEALEKDQSWGGWAADKFGEMVPFLAWERMSNAVKNAPTGLSLPGTTMAENVNYLHHLPPEDFARESQAAIEYLKTKNLGMAHDFAVANEAYSTSDAVMGNLQGLGDLTTIPDIAVAGKAIVKGLAKGVAKTGTEAATALKGAVKGVDGPVVTPERSLSAAGDLDKAASAGAARAAVQGFKDVDPLNEGRIIRDRTPTLFRPDTFGVDPGNLGREATARLVTEMRANSDTLMATLSDPLRVAQGTDAEIAAAIGKAKASLQDQYNHLDGSVIDTGITQAEDTAGNVHAVSIILGDKDANLFPTARVADVTARKVYGLLPGQYQVAQQGVSWGLRITKHVDMTPGVVKDLTIETNNKSPETVVNSLLGRIRSPDDVVSDFQNVQRKVATHGQQVVHKAVKEVAEPITSLPSKQLKDLNTILEKNRDYIDPVDGTRGTWHKNIPELEKSYLERHSRLPTEAEVKGYFTYRQLSDYDYVLRNLGLFRDKARLGIERFTLGAKELDADGVSVHNIQSKEFDGRFVDTLPTDPKHDAGILIHRPTTDDLGVWYSKNTLNETERAFIKELVDVHGYKIVQVANPLERPLARLAKTDETVHFIITKDWKNKKLNWDQLPYREGPHVEYKDNFYVKQPRIRRNLTEPGVKATKHTYEGDTTIFSASTEAKAKDLAAATDKARQLLRVNDPKLKDFLAKNLPYTEAGFKRLFEDTVDDAGEIIPARLHLDDAITHVASGERVVDKVKDFATRYEGWEDNIRNSYNLYDQIDKKFAGTRDGPLDTVMKSGTEAQPIYNLHPAKLIDPMNSMNRAMANVMRSRFMSDYKIQAIDSWVKEFGDLVAGVSREELRANPLPWFHDTKFEATNDMSRLNAAKNTRAAILNFLGSQTPLGKEIEHAQSKWLDSIYRNSGERQAENVRNDLLPFIKDPFRYVRAWAFHITHGFYNPMSYFKHAAMMTHAMLISPKHAIPGTTMAFYMRMLSTTKDQGIVEHIAGLASKFGLSKESFKESYEGYRRTGLNIIEGEHAWKNDTLDPKVFVSKGSQYLDKSSVLFREGVRQTRLVAWNIAYREWRQANPGRVMNNAAISTILNRQDLLAGNMTRASAASYQTGILSVPTQFWAWSTRISEQMLGKRLTTAEKLRVFTGYGAMYGLPIAGATFGVPFGEDIRQHLIDSGANPDSVALELLEHGIIQTAWKHILGADVNVSDTYGPEGVGLAKAGMDWYHGDLSVTDLIFGASGSMATQAAKMAYPFLAALCAPLTSDNDTNYHPTGADFLQAIQSIGTVSALTKLATALSVGKWYSRNGVEQDDITGIQAIFSALTGTSKQSITDARLIMRGAKEVKASQDAAQIEITKYFGRAIEQYAAGDQAGGDNSMKGVQLWWVLGDFKEDQRPGVIAKAIKDKGSMVEQAERKWLMNAPASQQQDRVKRFLDSEGQK